MESLLRLVCLLDCHILLLIYLSTNDAARETLSIPRMATRLWGKGGVCGTPCVFACEGKRLGGGVDGSCESTFGCAAGIFERDLAFAVMETSEG